MILGALIMTKKSLSQLDVYVPVLFKLGNDAEIIHSKLLIHIKDRLIETELKKENVFSKLPKDHTFDYQVNPSFFEPLFAIDSDLLSMDVHAFYYHHRLIFHAHISYKDPNFKFRNIRMALIDIMRDLTDVTVKKINRLILHARKTFKDEPLYKDITANLSSIKIKTFYQYCVVFKPENPSYLKRNTQIETFNIRTLQPKALPIHRTSLLRISIPNMTAYYTGKLHSEFTSEIINTVYKICLYEKKMQELAITEQYESYQYHVTKTHQVISEQMILDMWSYCIDAFGGKRTDQIGNKSAIVGLIFSLIALVFSIISLIQSLL